VKWFKPWHLFVLVFLANTAYFLLLEPLLKDHNSFSSNPILEKQPMLEQVLDVPLPAAASDYQAVIRKGDDPTKSVSLISFKLPSQDADRFYASLGLVSTGTGVFANIVRHWGCQIQIGCPIPWWRDEPRNRTYLVQQNPLSNKRNLLVTADDSSSDTRKLNIMYFVLK
jgi:hypothetical protein